MTILPSPSLFYRPFIPRALQARRRRREVEQQLERCETELGACLWMLSELSFHAGFLGENREDSRKQLDDHGKVMLKMKENNGE